MPQSTVETLPVHVLQRAARNRIRGKFLGGTGRYAGATGSYEFSWEWVIQAEDGAIQGRAIDLKGRVRAGPAGVPK